MRTRYNTRLELENALREFHEYAVCQELAEAERQGKPITREEAERRVSEFFKKEADDI